MKRLTLIVLLTIAFLSGCSPKAEPPRIYQPLKPGDGFNEQEERKIQECTKPNPKPHLNSSASRNLITDEIYCVLGFVTERRIKG